MPKWPMALLSHPSIAAGVFDTSDICAGPGLLHHMLTGGLHGRSAPIIPKIEATAPANWENVGTWRWPSHIAAR